MKRLSSVLAAVLLMAIVVFLVIPRRGEKQVSTSGPAVNPDPPAQKARAAPAFQDDLRADEAFQALGNRFRIPVRIVSAPTGRVSAGLLSDAVPKAVVKMAEQLGLPVLAAEPDLKTEPSEITLTAAAVIAGPSTPHLDRGLTRLAHNDADERVAAIADLAEQADQRLEEAYAHRLLNDPSPEVRAEAAAALTDAQRPASHAALVRALADPDSWVVDNARAAIQQVGAGRMEKALRAGLATPSQEARLEAANLLERTFGLAVADDAWSGGGKRRAGE